MMCSITQSEKRREKKKKRGKKEPQKQLSLPSSSPIIAIKISI